MSKWILFYVTANDCVNCKNLSVYWGTIQNTINTVLGDKIIIENIAFNERKQSSLDSTKYPVELIRYISWFPSFILVEKSHFDAVKEKKIKSLKASVFNGEVPDSPNFPVVQVTKEKKLPINGPSLLSWIEKEIQHSSSSPVSSPSIQSPIVSYSSSSSPSPSSSEVLPETQATCSKYKLKSRFSRS